MTYSNALEYLMNIPRFSKSLTLERIRFLLSALGNPQNCIKAVHIAGTNGKGSTTTMISRILMSAGYKVGTFISPFVEDFRERICVNGEFIEKNALAEITEKVSALASSMEDYPNAFEQITAIAMCYFKSCGCDIVCLETGLGGRWDATNVIPPPEVSVITSIGLDHMQFLGDTHEKIALEKCGIIKSGSKAVISPLQPEGVLDVILSDAESKNVPAIVPDTSQLKICNLSASGSDFIYKSCQYRVNLSGGHQVSNAVTAIEAVLSLKKLGYNISDADIYSGIKNSALPARMEIICKKPLCIVDGAHNAPGVDALCSSIDSVVSGKRLITVFGCLQDKSARQMIEQIAKKSHSFICVMPDSPKACTTEEMARLAIPHCKNVCTSESYNQAAEIALSLTEDDSVILICGSLYLAGPMKKEILDIVK